MEASTGFWNFDIVKFIDLSYLEPWDCELHSLLEATDALLKMIEKVMSFKDPILKAEGDAEVIKERISNIYEALNEFDLKLVVF